MSEKSVVKKIKFARRWLEKAEEAYLQGRSEEGLLSLSLAEAEIRALNKGEWEKALKLRKGSLRVIFEVSLLTVLLVLALASYPYVEVSSRFEGKPEAYLNIEPLFKLGSSGNFYLYVNLPSIGFNVHCKGGIGLRVKRGLDAHIFYVFRKERVKDGEERAHKAQERPALSAEEMLRLIELGRKEFKIYLTGGR